MLKQPRDAPTIELRKKTSSWNNFTIQILKRFAQRRIPCGQACRAEDELAPKPAHPKPYFLPCG
ncbi:hypothetical protein [Mesorhizobium sp. M0618]|uniref:hypothetical protein n=1 Tax=unclassified Mesorhizobium TaxID=325217 RepID=UPI0033368FE9